MPKSFAERYQIPVESFPEALDYVYTALSSMEDRGLPLRASLDSLAQLTDVAHSADPEPAPVSAETPAASVPRPPRPVDLVPSATPPKPAAPIVAKLPFETDFPISAPPVPTPAAAIGASKAERLAAMRDPVLACTKCPALVRTRTQVVFGVGNPEAELMFVGEAPGEDEDRRGEPFVGKAGQLLTKIIETMGFARADVYIANVLKCRPDMPPGSTGNRKPTSAEMQVCRPYLEEQISIIQPRALVALGATAMEGLLGEVRPMNQLRGRWHEFRGIPLMATYHPAYLLRNQSLSEKRKVWEDMLLVLEKLGKPISAKQRGFF
ncbi:MAG TPA: uracil-DNA glycosylase family protein, partial [Chthoniobacteraceae bacterium]